MRSIRLDIQDQDGRCSMTGITVMFEDNETDFEQAKAKALGYIVTELCRYGLHEALGGIGFIDSFAARNRDLETIRVLEDRIRRLE